MNNFTWILAFIGRPNAGKSSLISQLTALKPIIGRKPGTTRRINEYLLADKFKIIDAPGWGRIHNKSKGYEGHVKDSIINFFEENWFSIVTAILVIDVNSLIDVSERLTKKGIVPIDQELYDFLRSYKLVPIVAFNKMDKLPSENLDNVITYFKKLVNYETLPKKFQEAFIPVSAKTGMNLEILRDLIRKYLKEKGAEEYERFIKIR